ncbi:hypothetical protein MCAP1_003562 [Malassezia caprae]|uniref:Mitochondrial glycine transporter n=1 Tax=Malassezia caprae TaxID=1381934 RepID=A0AAF0EEN6_9BASI|nr:hypothetical protein MCAP1_003562 [Malassezia caprae]
MSETARPRTAPAWKTLGVGGAAGLVSCVLLQPMDLLKTRMQQERLPTATTATATQRLVRAFHSVVRDNGYGGLWRGTVPTIARNVPGVAAYFYTLNELRWLVAKWQVPGLSTPDNVARTQRSSTLARLSSTGNILSGALARVFIGLLLNPISIVKARYESSHYSKDAYPTLGASLRSLYREGGIRGFFRGFSATALRDAPYAGLYLAFYEQHKHWLGRWTHGESGAWWVVSASGLGAGILATVLTHPFDILKTRMQTTPETLLRDPSVAYRPSVFATARHILQADGLRAFADGLGLRCARKAASSMIGWSIFELGNRWVS